MLRDYSDEINDDPTVKKAVVSFVADAVENISVLQVTQAVFDTLCDKVLSSDQSRDGGHQVIYMFVCLDYTRKTTLQWNLRTRDTMVPAILSPLERLSISRRSLKY